MHVARKLVLLALVATAFMALTAGTASAVEVEVEATTAACPAAAEVNGASPEVTGGCLIKGTSVNEMEFGGPFGLMIRCRVDLEGRVSHTGLLVGTFTIPSCTMNDAEPCSTSTERHANAQIGTKIPGSIPEAWNLVANFCLRIHTPNLGEVQCNNLPGRFVQVSHTDQRLIFGGGTIAGPHQACGIYSLSGTIAIVVDPAHPAVEAVD